MDVPGGASYNHPANVQDLLSTVYYLLCWSTESPEQSIHRGEWNLQLPNERLPLKVGLLIQAPVPSPMPMCIVESLLFRRVRGGLSLTAPCFSHGSVNVRSEPVISINLQKNGRTVSIEQP